MYSASHLDFTDVACDKLPDDLLLVAERRLGAIARHVSKFCRVKRNTRVAIFET